MSIRKSWLAVFLLGVAATCCRAQGFVEHFEPPVLERGKTTRVTAVGVGLGKALTLWASVPGVKAIPAGTQTAATAVFDVNVAADAPVGICGVRLATEDGLANACLLLIDDLPVRAMSPTEKLPVALWGRFRAAALDRVAIDVVAGQRVSFEAVGSRFGKDVDPLIVIRDARGKIVAERDNDAGLYFDFRFEHTFAEKGTYTVELRDARFHGSPHGLYVLRMGKFPATRVAMPMSVAPTQKVRPLGLFFGVQKRPGDDGSTWLPLETTDADVTIHRAPGKSIDDGTLARVPGVLCGILQKPGARHFFRLDLAKGQRIQVRAEARAFNSPADLEIAITDAKGKELRRAVENAQEEISLDFNAGAPGIYGLTVRDLNRDGGSAFGYRLAVRTPGPGVQVSAEVEGLSVPSGDYQPVPLTVTRIDYTGKIALTLLGAPGGVTLTPGEIDAGVNTVVCKLAVDRSVAPGVHTLQIVARPVIENARPTFVRTRPLIDRQIVNVDLIPHALREDQRRLPPSLTDRLALQVTPPSFFTFELPEKLVTLPRYQHVDFPIVPTVQPGSNAKITYSAKGGQIAPKEEGRTRVYAEFTGNKGSIHSKILTNLAKHRVEVTGVAHQGGRSVALTRTFDLDIRAAYIINAEPALLKLLPGETGKLRLHAERLKTFDADIAVQLTPVLGLELPSMVVIPRGQSGVDIPVKVDPGRGPGRQNVNLNASALVNGFEEEQRGRFDVEVVKTPKK